MKLTKKLIRAAILALVIILLILFAHALSADIPIPIEDTQTISLMFWSAFFGILAVVFGENKA